MQRRRLAALAALGLMVGGCGRPEIVPLTPPGVALRRVSGDTMEAEGETRSLGAARPVNVSPEPTKGTGGEAPAANPGGK